MKNDTKSLNVLKLFANYGFRKVSMSDIAKAAELSRQSIYNQFGSKEAALDWAVTECMEEVANTAISELQEAEGNAKDALAAAYQRWIGDQIPLLNGTPHGGEILDAAMASQSEAKRNYEDEFLQAVALFLLKSGVSESRAQADDQAFVLGIAAKGLMLKSETSEAFAQGMARVIAVLFD